MQHADLLIERILFLDGLPRMQHLEKLFIGGSVPECLDSDLELERRGRAHYVDAIARCETARDFVSRDILQKILSDTEEHIDYLETQRRLIEETGLSNYLQTAMGGIAS
jgi:bacterioferritin